VEWICPLPIEDFDWNVGLIVGSSGSGKSTVARHFFGDKIVENFE
jgi:ABC-type dipeptide/oligopeptide/nickel transport system ATPase component